MRDLTAGESGSIITKFAIPMILGQLFQQSLVVADSIVVGKFIGKEALAAVGAAFPLIYLLIALVVGIATGGTIVIAQFFGAKNYEKINKAVDTINLFLLATSVIISVGGIYFCADIFRLIGLESEVIPLACEYMNIYLAGLFGLFGFYGISAILRGVGDSRTPLIFQIVAAVVNIILALIFVAVLHWGVAGSAWATVIAQGGTFIGAAIYLNRTHPLIKISVKSISFDKEIFKSSLQIGLPSGLQQTIVGLGMMALAGVVNRFGMSATAAYSVAGRIDMLASVPAMNYSIALSSFVGQNVGAQKFDRVKDGVRKTMIITIILSALLAGITMVFSKQLVQLFTADTNIIEIGSSYLFIVAPFYISFAVMFIYNGALRGAGDTLIPMFITIAAMWGVRVPLSLLFSHWWGITGLWWSVPSGWVIGTVVYFFYFKMGRWKQKGITQTAKHRKA